MESNGYAILCKLLAYCHLLTLLAGMTINFIQFGFKSTPSTMPGANSSSFHKTITNYELDDNNVHSSLIDSCEACIYVRIDYDPMLRKFENFVISSSNVFSVTSL